MDEATLRPIVEAHAQAVCDPLDIAHVQADMIEELHPALPQIAALLPQPVRSASVDALEMDGESGRATITYTGDERSVTIDSLWEDRGAGQPQIVEAAPQS